MGLFTYIPLLLLSILAIVVWKRGAGRFPWFFAYAVFAVLADICRFIVHQDARLYFRVYWITEVGYCLLGVAVLYEVFRVVFGAFADFWWLRWLFPSGIILSICVVLVRIHYSSIEYGSWVGTWIVNGELGVRFLQALMFVALTLLVPFIGLRWRQVPFGITAGFGIYATVALIATRQISVFGTKNAFLLDMALLVAYSTAVLIWIWFFLKEDEPEPPHQPEPPISPGELKRYKEFLRRMRK